MIDIRHADANDVLPTLSGVALIYADVDYGLGKYPGDEGDDFEWIRAARRALKPDGVLAISCHTDQMVEATITAVANGMRVLEMIVWRYHQRNGQPTSRLANEWEPILTFAGLDADPPFHPDRVLIPTLHPNAKTTRGDRRYEANETKPIGDVWDVKRVRQPDGFGVQKPLEILRRLILLYTEPGDLVVDPRGGTGTTGIAARALDRRSILIERNPERFEIMRRRVETPWQPGLWPTEETETK